MFDLLNNEIKEFRRKNKDCQIYIGKETLKTMEKVFNCESIYCNDGYVAQYRGININTADFDYGYYLK